MLARTYTLTSDVYRIGISWDPNQIVTLGDKIKTFLGTNSATFDLDVSCFIYGAGRTFLDYVSGMPGEMVDKSGSIRHSGDDTDGAGDGDDEHILVDLANCPSDVEQIIIVVEVASAHAFSDIIRPQIRFVKEGEKTEMSATDLSQSGKADNSACVWARLERNKHEPDKWFLQQISHFTNHEYIEDWPEYLTKYLL